MGASRRGDAFGRNADSGRRECPFVLRFRRFFGEGNPETHMPELGRKFTCYSCHTKFYDLGKPVPLCPKCGADQRDADEAPVHPAPRSRRAVVVEEPVEEEETTPAENESSDSEEEDDFAGGANEREEEREEEQYEE